MTSPKKFPFSRPNAGDWAAAATTVAWDLTPDVAATPRRRRLARAGVLALGSSAIAWSERDSLSDAWGDLREAKATHERIGAATTERELAAILDDLDADDADDPSVKALVGAAAALAMSLAAQAAMRRWTARRTAAGARFPRLPGAVLHGAVALVVGPMTRELEKGTRP